MNTAPSDKHRWTPWVVAGLALLIFGGVQALGGAYAGEFDAYPDEAAHFVTGLMVRDYVTHGFPGSPVEWAKLYYLHYPKVAFGHWPPLWFLVEAAWWLVVPPSHTSVLLLVGLLGLADAVLFFRMCVRAAGPVLAALFSVLLVLSPVFQESARECMAEMLSLLFGMLFLMAVERMLDRGFSRRSAVEMSLWCLLCILVKGTGAALLGAPFLAMILGRRGDWKRVSIWIGGLGAATIAAFLILHGSFREAASWAGIGFSLPWRIDLMPTLAGWGAVLAAIGGMVLLGRSRSHTASAAAAVVLSIGICSFFLRAMLEPRHWILALPALLILAASFVRMLREMPGEWWGRCASAGALVAILLLFPWDFHHRKPEHHLAILERLALPGRVLVSSADDWREGGWIAVQCLREKRPTSYMVRATKLLATIGWNGSHYRLLAETPEEVQAMLDRYGIDDVILDDRQDEAQPLAHHVLLKKTLAASSHWRECAKATDMAAWCRSTPAPRPYEMLRIPTSSQFGTIVEKR